MFISVDVSTSGDVEKCLIPLHRIVSIQLLRKGYDSTQPRIFEIVLKDGQPRRVTTFEPDVLISKLTS